MWPIDADDNAVGILISEVRHQESSSPRPGFWTRSILECNSLILDVVVETGLCKGVGVTVSHPHFLRGLSLPPDVIREQPWIQTWRARLPSSTSSASSPGRSGRTGWRVERCRGRGSSQGQSSYSKTRAFFSHADDYKWYFIISNW